MARQPTNDRTLQTWTLLKCAKCDGAAAQPYRATCLNSLLITVDVRCPDCHHEWRLTRESVEALQPLIPVVRAAKSAFD